MSIDADIVARALDGDSSATTTLCTAYAPRLRAYFRKHGLAHAQLDDAVQDTWLRLLDAISRRRIRKESLEGWLFATARNVRVDLIRHAQRARKRGHASADDVGFDAEPGSLERGERARTIQRAVNELPERLRLPIILRHKRALSYREIADELGISVNAVGVRIYRGRQLLQERLRDFL